MKTLLEVCTGSLASVEAAAEGGAERIELCAALPLDGLTPSLGTIRLVRQRWPQLRIHVLVRPREGTLSILRLNCALWPSTLKLPSLMPTDS